MHLVVMAAATECGFEFIDVVNEYLGDQDEDFYFKRSANSNSDGESISI